MKRKVMREKKVGVTLKQTKREKKKGTRRKEERSEKRRDEGEDILKYTI